MKPTINTNKTNTALCGLLSGLLLLAAGTTNAHAGVIYTNPTNLTNGETYRLVFITSTTHDALSTNIADYNSFVTSVANSVGALASLGTTWTALGTTASVNALTNTGTDWQPAGIQGVPIYLLNNTKLADNYDNLWTIGSVHYNPLNITENGDAVGNLDVWTGDSGQPGQHGMSLGAPFDLGGGGNVRIGRALAITEQWSGANFGGNGSALNPMYAISGALTAAPEPTSALLLLGSGAMLLLRRRRASV